MSDPNTVHRIPLTEIDASALSRDRAVLDEAALTELRRSIAAGGLRMPVELWPLPEPRPAPEGPRRYGLISGYRRLHAFHGLHEMTGDAAYATIPAFLRPARTLAQSLAAMVEENEIRASLSPWERGRIAWLAREQGVFASIEEAVERLYPEANRTKRMRLRTLAQLVEELDGWLTEPERLNQRQCLRLAAALQAGFGEVIRAALEETPRETPETQWQAFLPILAEAEQPATEATSGPRRPDRPRRVLRPRPGLTIRRERTREGYTLHFSGRDATCMMLDDVFDEIERLFAAA
jgi:ParB family chromosome partitioning protein